MALNYLQAATRAQDRDFRARVLTAICQCARDVAAEATNTANHQLRGQLAVSVLLDPVKWAERMAYGLSMEKADLDAPADADIFAAASALWNWYAGVVTS